MIRRLINITLPVLLICAPVGQLHAYMDPGTGSMILQVVLGGVAALGVMIKLYWHRFKALFHRDAPASEQDGDGSGPAQGDQ